jgi:hypothetical protein
MDDLLIALAGGAVGALLAGLAWLGLRVASIPGDLQRHDFEIRVLNEDLELWVSDTYGELRRELNGITNRMSSQGQLYSGAHGTARAQAKTRALHRWRDRLHEASAGWSNYRLGNRGSTACGDGSGRNTGRWSYQLSSEWNR